MKNYKVILNHIGYRIGYINGVIAGFLHGVKLDIAIFCWKLKHGFPSKEKLKANPELQRSLTAVIFKDADGRAMGAEVIMANLLVRIHAIVSNGSDYSTGPVGVISKMLFNQAHPDRSLPEICKLVDSDVDLHERVIHLFDMIDKYNQWRSGTLYGKVAFFYTKPEYQELLEYFERFGLPANIHWINTNVGE